MAQNTTGNSNRVANRWASSGQCRRQIGVERDQAQCAFLCAFAPRARNFSKPHMRPTRHSTRISAASSDETQTSHHAAKSTGTTTSHITTAMFKPATPTAPTGPTTRPTQPRGPVIIYTWGWYYVFTIVAQKARER